MTPSSLTPRRRAILDAATQVLDDQGLRGLTHRSVDRAAGLPEGTTSAYFRTRRALQLALTEYVASQMAEDVDALIEQLADCTPEDPRAVELVIALLGRWLDARTLVLAKVELTLEAARDPELAAMLRQNRDRLLRVVADVLAGHGMAQADARAEALMASFDGILLSALLKPDGERQDYLARSLDQAMHPLGVE
ncbi:putative transcriptional regulator, TetR family protein [Nocardioides szechwanensis]|uniref:Transcriptional regulator, TetR family n=1 Tax=Nocardioides szechwanensis TaxID=1005944 RepID=A0A1H0LEU4_9ACTN|nr:TetR/AcrR family transcriptional regulator [Nocardioides szechwanensis]GEP36169.1 putative transcriptional regulator, TetR family protein [Nocardioides szechwanensis]SDO66511.1 transcriptional regulator, TetR family [Nocardioides szechwanensis]